jgi:hypothetical protein
LIDTSDVGNTETVSGIDTDELTGQWDRSIDTIEQQSEDAIRAIVSIHQLTSLKLKNIKAVGAND